MLSSAFHGVLFLCVLASADYNSNQSSLELTFAVCLMVTVPYFIIIISLCLSSFMCRAMCVVYNANPYVVITFVENTVK